MTKTRCNAANRYIAIFICFTTKAIHLELVNSLNHTGILNIIKIIQLPEGENVFTYIQIM
jgi:hypothetical protein